MEYLAWFQPELANERHVEGSSRAVGSEELGN